ncbi:MAG: hypothetical protein CMQ36_04425, partial [Gammaproteobacteria bacterium]|nr:hypothetical protein [Gammaproteobacteria bacterium]
MSLETTVLCSSITVSVPRRFFLSILGRIKEGTLILREGNKSLTFGDGNPTVTVTVESPTFYRKALFGGTIGIGE